MGLLKLTKAGEEPTIDLPALQAAYVGREFGLFLHFNMSTFVDLDWAIASTPANTFNPTALDVQQWVDVAVAMGAKYAVLTTKHHDGFCLWPTATTVHSIASTSWYAGEDGVDIVREFVVRCRAAGIVPGLYFSIMDWRWEQVEGAEEDQAGYRARLEAQLRELLTGYGGIGMIWLDGAEWEFDSAYPWDSAAQRTAYIKSFQPQCLVVNNSHTTSFDHTDIIVYEGGSFGSGVPSENTDFAEVCDTMREDNNWFWKTTGNDCLDAETILSALSIANSRNAAYLLNAGPDNTGVIPANMVAVLEEVGTVLA